MLGEMRRYQMNQVARVNFRFVFDKAYSVGYCDDPALGVCTPQMLVKFCPFLHL